MTDDEGRDAHPGRVETPRPDDLSRAHDHACPRCGTLVAAAQLVGYQEIAARLGMRPGALRACRVRGTMPTPVAIVSGAPLWVWGEISRWARRRQREPKSRASSSMASDTSR